MMRVIFSLFQIRPFCRMAVLLIWLGLLGSCITLVTLQVIAYRRFDTVTSIETETLHSALVSIISINAPSNESEGLLRC